MGHIALGFSMVRERIAGLDGFSTARATDVGHLVLSHQGQLEWGSPVLPQTLEAITLHFIDNLDSKVAAARVHLADVEHGRTAFVRSLGRSLFRRGPAPVTETGEPPQSAGEAGSGDRADSPPANAPPSLFDD